jgi:hypothetical protein
MSVYYPKKDEGAEPQVTMSLPPEVVRRAAKGSNASQAEIARRVREQRETKGPESVAPNPFAGTMLRYGSSGEAVKYLQNALNAKGASLALDGAFGGLTHGAVTSFQSSAGLAADGIVGPNTWGAIGNSSAKVEEDKKDRGQGGGPATTEMKTPAETKEEPPLPKSKKSEKDIDDEIEAEDKTGGETGEEKTDGEKFREAYVKELLYFEGSYEKGPQSERFQEIMPTASLAGARKAAAAAGRTFTTCNTFTGILLARVQQKTGIDLLANVSLKIMNKEWREKNLPEGAFVKGGPGVGKRPRAGDIIIFSDKSGTMFKHMGNLGADPVTNDDGTEQWDCIDGGQGQAHDAKGENANEAILRLGMTFTPETGMAKKPGKWGQERLVYGWVDIAKLAGG